MRKKITYACFMNQSGYSQAARDLIEALDRSNNYDIAIKIFGSRPTKPAISDKKYEYFMKMTHREETDEDVMVYHCIPIIQKNFKHKGRSIGFGTFETFQPPSKWIEILNQNDAIIVPSKFNYKIFCHEQIKKPIFYIPHSIDFDVFNMDVKPLRKFDKFTFLFMGIWRERKGIRELIEAWIREFSERDPVQLLIHTDSAKKADSYIQKVKKDMGIKQGIAPIIIEDKVLNDDILPNFLKSVNCLISPTMGEGFGLPGLQCMALGIPVSITNFSGCTDYANEETAFLLEPSGFILKNNMDGIPQFRNKKWAFLEVKHICNIMRQIVAGHCLREKKISAAYEYVRHKFDYNTVENLFGQMIREVYG